jgi:hypothetical protein
MELTNRVAVITGGKRIGAVVAIEMAKQGIRRRRPPISPKLSHSSRIPKMRERAFFRHVVFRRTSYMIGVGIHLE